MAAPAEVSEKRSNFRIRQFKEKRLFNIAANLTLNTMVSFVILRIARTARIACSDRYTYIQTDRQTHETMKSTKVQTLGRNIGTFGLETPIGMHYVLGIYRTSFQHNLHCFIDACVHVVNNLLYSQ